MVIDPDRDLLIFRMRKGNADNKNKAAKPAKSLISKINFNVAEEELISIEKPIVSKITDMLGKIRETKIKVPKQIINKNQNSENYKPIIGENQKELDELDKKIDAMLEVMNKINSRQKEIENISG